MHGCSLLLCTLVYNTLGYSWMIELTQVTRTYHSEHTAWLLYAECLHYLKHIHNTLCLATLHGTDE